MLKYALIFILSQSICLTGTSQKIHYKDGKWIVDQKIVLQEFTRQYNLLRDSFGLKRLAFSLSCDTIASGHAKYIAKTGDYQHGMGDKDFSYTVERMLGRKTSYPESFGENLLKAPSGTLTGEFVKTIKIEVLEPQIGHFNASLVLGLDVEYEDMIKEVIEIWMNSPGHRKFLLKDKLSKFSFNCQVSEDNTFFSSFVAY